MTQITITGINTQRPILAIKGVRKLTGLSLYDTKKLIDAYRDGGTPEQNVTVLDEFSITEIQSELREAEVDFRYSDSGNNQTLELLRRLPSHLTVGEVLAVLVATA